MKLLDIVKSVGSTALQVALPGTGSLIVGTLNELLPDEKKLPATASGNDIGQAIGGLSPEQQAFVMEKEYDIDITQIKESNSTVRTMLESDAKNPHSTRPYIAKHAFHTVAFVITVTVSMWAYGVGSKDVIIVETVMEGWPFVLAVIGPLVSLLWAYFGILRQEHKNRLDAANGSSTPGGLAGIISSVLRR